MSKHEKVKGKHSHRFYMGSCFECGLSQRVFVQQKRETKAAGQRAARAIMKG